MAFQSVPNTVQIAVIYTLNSVVCQNVFYAKRASGYVLSDLSALANQIDLNVGATWLPDQPLEASYLRTEVRGLDVENDLFVVDNSAAGPGEDLSSTLPNNVTFSVKKSSALTGRSARGRTFWIGIPQNKLKTTNENELTAAYAAEVVANVDLIRTQTNVVDGWQAVLVSRITGGVKRPFGVVFDWLTTSSVDELVDTNRGRLT